MAQMVAGAPLLAGGPPGWVAYGVLAVVTLGAGAAVYMQASSKSKDLADTKTDTACASCKKNPCDALRCGTPGAKYRGGAHDCMTGTPETKGDMLDSHHTPAKANSPLPPSMGPAIQMDAADHRQTASYGRSSTDPYMQAQKALIDSGNFSAAIAMDVADITSKFPGKYDAALAQMGAYAACLKANGLVR